MSYKNLFYGYEDKNIYLDNAASTLSLKCVKEEGDNFLLNYGSLHRGFGYNSEISTEKYEESRNYILSILDGTKNDCVIFTANTTDAINKFSLLFPFSTTDKVLISDIEHSSNSLPWRKHSNVIEFKTNNYKIEPEIIEQYLKTDTNIKVVALAAASNITGYIIDLEEIYRICKKYNTYLFIDASQYAPHNKPSLKYCDFIAYCGHKMYAPFGCGVLAGRKDILNNEGLSLTGGGNVIYVDEKGIPTYKDAPYLHEAGTPNGIGAITLAKAHQFLFETIGEEKLIEHNKILLNELKIQSDKLKYYNYDVYFSNTDEYRTPIMIIDNKKISNKETVKLLNTSILNYEKNVFIREGAFCSYLLIENLKNLKSIPNKIVDGHLNSQYSLIRLSASLINDIEDIQFATNKLIKINQSIF